MRTAMKYFVGVCTVIVGIVGGCDKAPNSYQSSQASRDILAEKMLMPTGIPKEALNYSLDDYKKMVMSDIPILAKRMSADETVISMDELSVAIDVTGRFKMYRPWALQSVPPRLLKDTLFHDRFVL